MNHYFKTLLFATFAMLLISCGPSLLKTKDFENPYTFSIDPEAHIPKNEENFEVLKTVQTYRDAMVNKDIITLKDLVSRDYYENASTTDDLLDDYGNEKIDELLNDYLVEAVKDIRYIIVVKQLNKEDEEFHVDYQYIWNFRFELAGQSYWHSKNDTNRLTIVKDEEAWKIKGGM